MQCTLREEICYEGIGLHSGKPVHMTIKPAAPDSGLVFRRVDLPEPVEIPARIEFVVDTRLNTTLGSQGAKIMTVEHLLASLAGMGVDNAVIELDNEEVPVGDGSALLFCQLIQRAGVVNQEVPRNYRQLQDPISVSDQGRYMVALPADEFRVSFTFVTDHPVVGTQYAEYAITSETFLSEIAAARTVGFAHQIEAMRRQGLALGGSLELAVVVGDSEYVNELRFPNEIVRHKILDIVGDLALLGPLKAHVIAIKSGHQLDAMLAQKLAAATAG